jgi:hypothetical protein
LSHDPLGILKRYDALPLVCFRMLALGILKQEHDTLTLIRWKFPGIPLKTAPGRRLA